MSVAMSIFAISVEDRGVINVTAAITLNIATAAKCTGPRKAHLRSTRRDAAKGFAKPATATSLIGANAVMAYGAKTAHQARFAAAAAA